MKKLMLGLLIAFAVTAEAAVISDVQIGDLKYSLDTESKTATITDYDYSTRPTMVDVAEVEYQEQKYTVTSVGDTALLNNPSLTSVCLPNATTIGMGAFNLCGSLTSVCLPNATTIEDEAFLECDKLETVILSFGLLANPDRESWKLRNEAKLLEPFTNDEVENATHKVAVFAGEKMMSGENYENGCVYYGITPKTAPQVVQEGEIAVKKTELQAAKAEAVTIADGVVSLAVGVCSNGNFTAETKNWAPVELKQENVEVKDGKIVISIPVSDKSGFMILQSGDAKVSDAAVTHEPWYTPTAED